MTDNQETLHTPDDHAKVEALVAVCIEALGRGEPDPATRVCSGRPDLLLRVRQRLAQLAARGLIPGTDELPSSIGPYRVLRELGSGGMGHVYLAEQAEPVRRHVALKVIKLGMDTREVVARFQAERQALALMNHPHIAQVFDAGITSEGRPFFAMEHVGGTMLTSFCDQRALATAARVRLMATVCRAVQHAHDRGFIHRDLKPSNVLVTEHEGEFLPKIIDFGIAKATAAAGDNAATQLASLHTRADQLLGTPEYMSPEQLCSGGLDIDTRTDVYSLGVTLYELLCGELPFDSERLRRAPRTELEHILQDELPTGPSRRLSLAASDVFVARGGERTTVQRAVAGELDWITLKALAKNRDQRYRSALALAEDLERWLRHEPVFAAPPGRAYRLRKFVRRHRVAVSASVAVLLSLVAGLAVSLRALAREASALGEARSFYGLARDAVGNLVDVADERLADVPQADPARRRMLVDAITFYQQLRADNPQDPALRTDMLGATGRIGSLQRRLGQVTDALATLQRCIADVDALCAERPAEARVRALAMTTNSELATTLTALGRHGDARAALQTALGHVDAARSLPDRDARHFDVNEARLLASLAVAASDDVPLAIAFFEQALAIFERLGSEVSDRDHVRCIGRYAEHLTRANRLDEAAALLTGAIARLQSLPAGGGVAGRESEARVQDQFAAVLRRLDRHGEARTAQERAIALYDGLSREHPDVPVYADAEASALHFLANLDRDTAKAQDALQAITRAVEIRERIAAAHPQNHGLTTRCVRALVTKSRVEGDLWVMHGGDKAVAIDTIARAVQLADALYAAHRDDLEVAIAFAAAHAGRGSFFAIEQRFADARRAHLAVREVLVAQLGAFATSADLHYQLALNGHNLMQVSLQLQEAEQACTDGEQGVVHVERGLALDARHRQALDLVPTLLSRLAIAYDAAGKRDDGLRCVLRLCEQTEWGADTKEHGAMFLCNRVTAADADEQKKWMARAQEELRAAMDARGDLAAALARPPQLGDQPHHRSRLRDLELRLALTELLLLERSFDEAVRVHLEAARLCDSMPELRGRLPRKLYRQRAEAAFGQQRPGDAAAEADAMLALLGPDGGANYQAGAIYARCHALTGDGAAKEAFAVKAIECLRRARNNREVKPEAIAGDFITWLRGHAGYEAMLLEK